MTPAEAVEAQVAEALKQKINELDEKLRVARVEARDARDRSQGLVNRFHEQEGHVDTAQAAYDGYQFAIVQLDKAWKAEKLPSEKETTAYETQRASLERNVESSRHPYIAAKGKLEQVRMEALKADGDYVRLAQVVQTLENLLDAAKDEANQIGRDPWGRRGGVAAVR